MCQSEDCDRVSCAAMDLQQIYTPKRVIGVLKSCTQRTAKIVTYHDNLLNKFSEFGSKFLVDRTNWTRSSYKMWKIRARKAMQRLKQVLVVGTYLLSIVSIPSSLSAPTSRHMADRYSSRPKWINPCGFNGESLTDSFTDVSPVTTTDLLATILTQAKMAQSKAEHFKESFAQKTLQEDFNSYHERWKNQDYDWLPTKNHVTKMLGEELEKNNPLLRSLKLDRSLITIYEQLQMIAVGLEQVIWDQEDENGSFLKEFQEAEFYLRSLLCEIQMAIIELGLKQNPDITRDHMEKEFRNMDSTGRNLRDFLIYRDYMIMLEYTIQAFTYIKNNL